MYYDRYQRQLAQIKGTVKPRAQPWDVLQHEAEIYHPLHDDVVAGRHRFYNLPGGRGSCKSSFVSLEIVSGIMQDETGLSSAIVFRRTGSTLRESVFSQISWAIDVLGVADLWKATISPLSYTYKPTGAQIIFRGLDDYSKLKSIKPRRGAFKFIWFEEFSELPGPNFVRSVLQSVMRGGDEFICFRSFNPPQSRNNWANVFIADPDPRAVTLHTTYLDVPAEWLGPAFLEEAERLKAVNPSAYEHEYLGKATGTGGAVFENLEAREITDDEIKELQYIYAGIDFGFSVDPAVFLRVAYDRKHDTVYLLNEIYQRHLSNKQLADKIKAQGFDKAVPTGEVYHSLFGPMTFKDEKQLIICDSAEPKSISDLQGEGLKAIACTKYPGSVNYGIKWLQHRRIVADPARTPNAYREFMAYEYERTKDGELLADVPDKDNHTIDAARYALQNLIGNRREAA